ncbi:MAG: hypothetical protein PHV06_06255 [bacterium]|nr:hypothetical protein [bacterium]
MKRFIKSLFFLVFLVFLSVFAFSLNFEIGDPVIYKSLVIFPVINPESQEPPHDYITLADALAEDLLDIKEIDEGGSVNTLSATNKSNRYIYLMAGDIIEGAKQNRTIGVDVILKPLAKNVKIPVFCVEQGRWTYASDEFSSRNKVATGKVRSAANYDGNQSQVWTEVSKTNSLLNTQNETDALTEMYDSEEIIKKVKEIKTKFIDLPSKNPKMVGVVVFIGKDGILDVFGNHLLFEKKWESLLESYIIDSLSAEQTAALPSKSSAKNFLQTAIETKEKEKQSGINTEVYKVESKDVKGTRVKDDDGNDLHINAVK